MDDSVNHGWQYFQAEWRNVYNYLKAFFKNPVHAIRHIPEWDWRTVLILQASVAAITGLISGVVSGHLTQIVLGVIFLPITGTATLFVVGGFFYYLFLFFLGREISYKQLYLMLVMANLPFMALYSISPLLKPLLLVGLAATSLLLIVGFVDYFILPKKTIVRIISTMYLLYVVMWISGAIQDFQKKKSTDLPATRESLDILEKELKGE